MKKLLIAALLASAAALALIIYQNQPKQELSLSAQLQEVLKNPETDFPQLQTKASKQDPVVTLKTSQGDITLKLFPEYAPLAVENFLTHAKEGYYDGLSFHRVIKDFMIQTGDPKGDGSGGESIWAGKDSEKDPGTGFKNEISPYLYNIRGAVSMANAGPDTNGSQFFINQNTQDISSRLDPNTYHSKIVQAYKNGGNPNLDGSYTVFGQVIQGMDVVDKIAATETDDQDKPKEAITIQKITIQSE